jgi:hypothetical protein
MDRSSTGVLVHRVSGDGALTFCAASVATDVKQ